MNNNLQPTSNAQSWLTIVGSRVQQLGMPSSSVGVVDVSVDRHVGWPVSGHHACGSTQWWGYLPTIHDGIPTRTHGYPKKKNLKMHFGLWNWGHWICFLENRFVFTRRFCQDFGWEMIPALGQFFVSATAMPCFAPSNWRRLPIRVQLFLNNDTSATTNVNQGSAPPKHAIWDI